MRKPATRIRRCLAGLGIPLGMTFAAPAFAATLVIPPDWPNYLLLTSIGALALGLTVRALEGRGGSRNPDASFSDPDSIDVYRNRVLKP